MAFNTRTGGQQDVAQQGYTELRVLKGERRGKFFKNPVSLFVVAPSGTAGKGASISFKVGFTKGVQGIQILRGIVAGSRDPGAAAVLQSYQVSTLPNSQIRPNVVVNFADTNPFVPGSSWYYWLRVLPVHSTFQPLLAGPILVAIP